MRISAGTAKGRNTAPKRLITNMSSGKRLRPTSAKVREALFDILQGRIEGASFVDLYAGTGTVGFEALSRGAEKAVLVEPNEAIFRTIKKTAANLGFEGDSRIIRSEASEFLKRMCSKGEYFDIFFLDPPYQSEEIETVLALIGSGELMSERCVVVAEHSAKKRLPERAGLLKMTRTYKYGDTMLTRYEKIDL